MSRAIVRSKVLGDLELCVVGGGLVADRDLAISADRYRRGVIKRSITMHVVGDFVLSPEQRRRLTAVMGERETYVSTESPFVRGLLTAMRWIGLQVTIFDAKKLEPLLAKIGVPEGYTMEQVLQTAAALRSEVAQAVQVAA